MLVKPDERVPMARLLKFLELGEELAHDSAKAQAALAPGIKEQRFLLSQARQESYHALVFRAPSPGWLRAIWATRRFCRRWKNTGENWTMGCPGEICMKRSWRNSLFSKGSARRFSIASKQAW